MPSSSQTDRKMIGVILITIIAIVSVAGLIYYAASEPNQNIPAPTPTPTPEPTTTPTPSPSPSEEPTEPVFLPKPSVPEFTVEFVDESYDVPPTYGVDQYTGEEVVITAGVHMIRRVIKVTIKNEAFISYNDTDGNVVRLYYAIRIKGHFGGSWYCPDYSSYPQYDDTGARINYRGADSDSEYTVITYGLVGNSHGQGLYNLDISSGDQVDFQVQALIGYRTRVNHTVTGAVPGNPADPIPHHFVFSGETSGWSNTQTIKIP